MEILAKLYLPCVVLHILAAILWVGGNAFMIMAFFPALREPEHRGVARTLLLSAGRRFRKIGTACLHLLLLTGLVCLYVRTGFNMKLGATHIGMTKLLLLVVAIALSTVHDKVIGPKATAAWEQDPQGAEALALRAKAALIGRINFAISIILVLMGIWIVRPL
jgi:uncharacterized membrane protein